MIVITRPDEQAKALLSVLQKTRHAALHLPGLAIQANPKLVVDSDTLTSWLTVNWWFFTSKNAIQFTAPHLQTVTTSMLPFIAVMGQGSIQQLRHSIPVSADHKNIVQPLNGHTTEALLEHPKLQRLTGQTGLIFNAPGGRTALTEGLRQRGASIDEIPVYHRRTAELSETTLKTLTTTNEPLTLLWTSNTALKNLSTQLPNTLWRKLLNSTHLVLSERQRIWLQERSAATVHVAHTTTKDYLVNRLIKLADEHTGTVN